MAHHLIHPALAQTLRAAAHRIGAWALPDEDPPTLILEQLRDQATARPLHRIALQTGTPACMGTSCHEGRSQCRTPEACYLPEPHESRSLAADLGNAMAMVVCIAILAIWAASFLVGLGWDDALRVLSSLAGV